MMDVERSTAKIEAGSLSLTEARAIVSDLFAAVERIYWIDFLTTISVGFMAFGLARLPFELRLEPLWLRLTVAGAAFSIECACFYRAVMFVHEIVHLPQKQFTAFRIVWNVLCGIPFLVPSFTYSTHLDHHRRKMFGTEYDGEYLPLASLSPWWILVYLSQCLWVPPLAVVRFGAVTPLTWVCPPLRRWVHAHASSLVMDPSYFRPAPSEKSLRVVRLQEVGCFLYLLACVFIPLYFLHHWPIPLAIQAYATGVVLALMNCLRTLASHRWSSKGKEMTFVEQMLDSVTLDNDLPLAVLLNPVGLRYHATHHLFPSLPYHNMRAAHRRLMERLPANSPYRRTVAKSLWPVIADLWHRAAGHARVRPKPSSDKWKVDESPQARMAKPLPSARAGAAS